MTEHGPLQGLPRRLRRLARRLPLLRARHDVRLLETGAQFFPALEAAIDAARDSVRLETYIFHDDRSGRRVAAALARAAGRGLEVSVVLDGFGTGALSGEVAQILHAASVPVRVFRPVRRGIGLLSRRLLRRLHRKLVLVDDEWAFVGGINVLHDRTDPHHGALAAARLDYAVQVRGPLVAQVRTAMLALWHELGARPVWPARAASAAGALATEPDGRFGAGIRSRPSGVRAAFTETSLEASPAGPRYLSNVRAAVVLRDNRRQRRSIERAYLRAIGAARHEVLIACAYFFPGGRFRRALARAVARGVRVRLLLQGRVEYRLAHFATQALYDELLAAGIEIIEYRESFLHAKVALADDWLTVGSSNIDPFSLLLAREANVIIRDARLAALLRDSLEAAIARAGVSVQRRRHAARPWWTRLVHRAAVVILRAGVALSGRGLRY